MEASMRLCTLLKEAGLPLPDDRAVLDTEIRGICSESRMVKKGELFVALRGFHNDGALFVSKALERGASFVISEQALLGKNTMAVDSARRALAMLLDAWYGHPARGMSLIGITGTNGKTSTATMLFHILRQAGYSVGLIGTVECRFNEERLDATGDNALANMTTPDPAQLYKLLYEMRLRGANYVVMEVTSHALALEKTAPLFFSRAVFTNLTPDHLDMHGDMESYFLEKAKLFSCCEQAILSFSTPYGERLATRIGCPFSEVSGKTVGDISAKGSAGVAFTFSYADEAPFRVFLPVPGVFSVENGALAAMTARSLGVSATVIGEALAQFGGVKGRLERIGENDFGFTVFLDYAHTPDALEKLLMTVRGFADQGERICALFGCGGDRDRSKRPEMGRVASRLCDFLILTSDNCRTEDPEKILADILRGVDKEKPHIVIKDRKEAILYAIGQARRGDILLLAGKGHEEYEIRGRRRLPFSEREIVKAALERRMREGERADRITE